MLRHLDVDELLQGDRHYDEVAQAVLAAALAEFTEFGLSRSSMAAVAQRAGVSRMTVHRRFPGKTELASAVFMEQFQQILAELGLEMSRAENTRDQLVDGMTFGIGRVAGDPLMSKLLQSDPESMLPYLTSQAGDLMTACTAFIASVIGPDNPEADHIAEAVMRICHSILLTPTSRFDLTDPDTLRHYLERTIDILLS